MVGHYIRYSAILENVIEIKHDKKEVICAGHWL